MNIDEYNRLYSKNRLKSGYTTGTCAAAAAKAAFMLLNGKDIIEVKVATPAGVELAVPVYDIEREADSASCAVKKYSGDDPDITDGMLIYAKVRIKNRNSIKNINVYIEGGQGIGRVTRPGLEQKVGEAAINSTPRRMIRENIIEAAEQMQIYANIEVLIYAPGGEEIGKKTFNPKLGIKGGISILGTTGIVTPMSRAAIIDTIKVEMKMKALLSPVIIGVPGNYGLEFTKKNYGIDENMTVEFSNYIGEAIDAAVALEAEGLLLIGHIGKFVKLAAGIMNTHSNEADGRTEIMAAHVLKADLTLALSQGNIIEAEAIKEDLIKKKYRIALKILDSNTTGEAVHLLKDEKILSPVMRSLTSAMYRAASARADKAVHMLRKNKDYKLNIGIITFTNEDGELARSGRADELLKYIKNNIKL